MKHDEGLLKRDDTLKKDGQDPPKTRDGTYLLKQDGSTQKQDGWQTETTADRWRMH
jgi:hypothetical protein